MKQNKLLNKTLRYYLVFGFLMALFIVPVFYVAMRKYYNHEIDEYLSWQRKLFFERSLKYLKISEITTWNQFNDEETIFLDTGQIEDDFFVTEYLYSKYEGKCIPYRILYSQVDIEGEKYILTIRLNIYETRKILQTSALLQLFLFICLMASMILITGLIHGKLWKPFYRTISLTEQFNIQNNEVPDFPLTATQEFEQLNQALKRLIKNNLQAYKIQKEFTENASHEMQTPLAIFRSKLDILLQQSGLTKEQLKIIQTLNEASSRLIRMNKNLLLLAKMDNLQFPDTQMLNVGDLLDKSLSFLLEQTEVASIALETQFADRNITLQANKMLVESLVNNLLTNAIRHNVRNGKILVRLEKTRLIVLNSGSKHPLDNTQIFRRFGRMNTATQGSGLGLAIVKQICLLYGWQIDYGFENGMHRFEVKFRM